ncbi:MAG: hypothetical protein Q9218_001088 [Villophora microphyllina]
MSIASKQPLPDFLKIPPELREEIYRGLYNEHPPSLIALLTVHPVTSREVGPWIFKLPQTFNGQERLLDWLSRVDPGLLSNVNEVRFRLQDIDSKQIMESFAEGLRSERCLTPAHRHDGRPYSRACNEELLRIESALQSFQNLKSLTLLETTDAVTRDTMMKNLVALALKELPLVSLGIPYRLLRYVDGSEVLRIQRMHITNHVLWAPRMDFPKGRFPAVRELKICGGCRISFTYDDRGIQETITQFHDFTIPWDNLPALQDLTLCLYMTDSPQNARAIQGYECALLRYIDSLEKNARSLRTFRLGCSDAAYLMEKNRHILHQFLRLSSLTHIETAVTWAPPMNQYPPSVVTIAIRFEADYVKFSNWRNNLYRAIDPARTTFFVDHPQLKTIALYLPSSMRNNLGPAQDSYLAAEAICRDHSVRVKILHEVFACGHPQSRRVWEQQQAPLCPSLDDRRFSGKGGLNLPRIRRRYAPRT